MELYEHARPGLLAGKRLLYVHGFASSGQTGSVKTLRLLLPDATVIAPDVPVDPHEAISFLKETVGRESPDVIIGTSMGGMYAEMLHGTFRILVNPAFQLADTILKNNGLGKREFHNPRADGQTSFLVNKAMLEDFRDVSSHCFENAEADSGKVFGLFGIHDNLVHTFDLFSSHYPQAIRFDGEHHLNDSAILHAVMPVLGWIDDKLNERSKPVLFISLDDTMIHHTSGIAKVVSELSWNYDVQIVIGVPYNKPEEFSSLSRWSEDNLGVPVWNRITSSNRKDLLLGDYLIDAHPESNFGDNFMGTLLHFGTDAFRTWEDVLEYFSRLAGQ